MAYAARRYRKHGLVFLADKHVHRAGNAAQRGGQGYQCYQSRCVAEHAHNDLVKTIVDKYKLDIPVLKRDEAHLEEPREITFAKEDYGRTIHVQGTILVLHVPFTGDAGMFWVQPTNFDSAPPSGDLNGQEMILKMRGSNLTSQTVEKHFNSILDDFERYLNCSGPTPIISSLSYRSERVVRSRLERRDC